MTKKEKSQEENVKKIVTDVVEQKKKEYRRKSLISLSIKYFFAGLFVYIFWEYWFMKYLLCLLFVTGSLNVYFICRNS